MSKQRIHTSETSEGVMAHACVGELTGAHWRNVGAHMRGFRVWLHPCDLWTRKWSPSLTNTEHSDSADAKRKEGGTHSHTHTHTETYKHTLSHSPQVCWTHQRTGVGRGLYWLMRTLQWRDPEVACRVYTQHTHRSHTHTLSHIHMHTVTQTQTTDCCRNERSVWAMIEECFWLAYLREDFFFFLISARQGVFITAIWESEPMLWRTHLSNRRQLS